MSIWKKARRNSLRILRPYGVRIPKHFPILDQQPVRTSSEIARRFVQLDALMEFILPEAPRDWLLSEIEKGDLWQGLTARERRVLETTPDQLPEQDRIDISWYGESECVLCWALGVAGDLPMPTAMAQREELLQGLPREFNIDEFIRGARITRSDAAIISNCDLYYCMHWAVRDKATDAFDESVVMERRRAFEWLITDEDWDEIELHT